MMISRLRPGSIVVPWDFSEEARLELETALPLVDAPSMIRVVHVAPSDTSSGALASEITHDKMLSELTTKFQQQMQDNDACQDVMFYVVHGGVAMEIASFAQDYQAGLIVMGTRDHWAITRLLRGSITSEVVHTAPCPVLILRHTGTKESPRLNVHSAS